MRSTPAKHLLFSIRCMDDVKIIPENYDFIHDNFFVPLFWNANVSEDEIRKAMSCIGDGNFFDMIIFNIILAIDVNVKIHDILSTNSTVVSMLDKILVRIRLCKLLTPLYNKITDNHITEIKDESIKIIYAFVMFKIECHLGEKSLGVKIARLEVTCLLLS